MARINDNFLKLKAGYHFPEIGRHVTAFNEANPETTLQPAYFAKAPVPASYGSVNYWSTNAFEFVNARGASQFVRWQFVPERGTLGLTEAQEQCGEENRADLLQ